MAILLGIGIAGGTWLLRDREESPDPELITLYDDVNWSVNGVNCMHQHGSSQIAQETWFPELRRQLAQAIATARLERAKITENQQELYELGLGLLQDALALMQGEQRDVEAMNGTLGVFRAGMLELQGAPQSEIDAVTQDREIPRITTQQCSAVFSRTPT